MFAKETFIFRLIFWNSCQKGMEWNWIEKPNVDFSYDFTFFVSVFPYISYIIKLENIYFNVAEK